MAERLTRNNKVNFYFHDEASNMVYYKLQDLEDIMAKYDIENLDTLEHIIKKGKVIIALADEELQKDRNTWKRACELACRHIAEVEWFSSPETDDISESENEIKTLTKQALYRFYQQAKEEKENE